ncbi:hypothetical protein U1839_23930 [Sphingomonas sp. RT2P30]|uniref:hypothetical protein n=1 Tax=Parasphingomonas halimpatiens TaxID=3096162 RepID=UPI002FCA8E99
MNLIKTIAAAGLLLSTATIATGAEAQDYRDGPRYEQRDHRGGYDRDRHDRRDDRRHYGWDRGHHYGWDRHHRRCWTEWHHHRQVRICR